MSPELKRKAGSFAKEYKTLLATMLLIGNTIYDKYYGELATDIKYIKMEVVSNNKNVAEFKEIHKDLYTKIDKIHDHQIYVNDELCDLWKNQIHKP